MAQFEYKSSCLPKAVFILEQRCSVLWDRVFYFRRCCAKSVGSLSIRTKSRRASVSSAGSNLDAAAAVPTTFERFLRYLRKRFVFCSVKGLFAQPHLRYPWSTPCSSLWFYHDFQLKACNLWFTYMSMAKTVCGRPEVMADLFSRSSTAKARSFIVMIV
jgi:hypothetical protein